MIDHTNWYQTFFKGLALDMWESVIPDAYTQKEIDFIEQVVPLKPGSRILDAPCGFGRHTLALAQRGYKVTGVDLSEEYIEKLRRQAMLNSLSVSAVNADLLQKKTEGIFDTVVCLGNSFSYFSPEKMQLFIARLTEPLVSGGSLVIHTGSLAECLLPHLESSNWMEVGDILFLMKHEYDWRIGALKTDMTFIKNSHHEKKTAYHYVFTLRELQDWLQRAGMLLKSAYSGLDQKPFTAGDEQAYLLAVKV